MVLPLPDLLQAGAVLQPEDAHLLCSAAGMPSSSDVHRITVMVINDALRKNWEKMPPADILAAATALAGFFTEFVDEQPVLLPADDVLPRLCQKLPKELAAERVVIDWLWDILKEDRRFLAARRVLQAFAQQAPPVVYVGSVQSWPWLADFLRQCANGRVVYSDDVDEKTGEYFDLQTPIPETSADAVANVLRGDLPAADAKEHLPQECREGFSASLSSAAMMALETARKYAENGKPVGIVVYDRLLARRLRAAAENSGVLIEDAEGWRMETLSFGGAMREWVDAVTNRFSPLAFGRLLRAPFWHGKMQCNEALIEWRKLMSGDRALPGSLLEAAAEKAKDEAGKAAFAVFAEELYQSQSNMPAPFVGGKTGRPRKVAASAESSAKPLSEWINWLLKESATALALWQHDAVAVRLRGALNMAAADGEALFSAEGFRHWLGWFMEKQTVSEHNIDSRVSFVGPKTQRQFEGGLILLGAHAESLPSSQSSFPGERRRMLFNLPKRDAWMTQQLKQFSRLVCEHKKIAAIWHNSGSDGRPQMASPFWTLLTDSMKEAKHCVKQIQPLVINDKAANVVCPERAAARAARMPDKLRITGLSNLMKCPYHFYAKDMLRLDEDEENEYLSSAAQGQLLHEAMERFADSARSKADMAALRQCWNDAFLPKLKGNKRQGEKMAMMHWREQGDKFLAAEADRREEGWRIASTEKKMTETLKTAKKDVILSGKMDRLDSCKREGGETQWQVMDYKTGPFPPKYKMKQGEEPQLPFYAVLSGHKDADWQLSNPAKGSELKVEDGDAEAIVNGLRGILREIANGALMPANGALQACSQCASRRLCRRDHIAAKTSGGGVQQEGKENTEENHGG